MPAPIVHEYSMEFYQETTKKNATLPAMVREMMRERGIVREVGKIALRVLSTLAEETEGNIYLVFNDGGWNVPYELTVGVEDKVKSHTRFSQLKKADIASPLDLTELVRNHVERFGGYIAQTRMGPVICYPPSLDDLDQQRMIRYYESTSSELRAQKERYGLAMNVVKILQEQKLLG